jgi:acyl carrier protein
MVDEIIAILKTAFDGRLRNVAIADDTRLVEDLGLDSMEIVELQVSIEDRFDFRFRIEETDFLEVFSSVGSLSQHVFRGQLSK